MEADLKQLIYDYLSTQKMMALATCGERPWSANLYFVHDNDLNLYFLSKRGREHSQAVAKNPEVSVAIADSHQPIWEPQKGIQASGTAAVVNVVGQLEWMFKMWNKLIAGAKGEQLLNPRQFLDAGVSSIYKITPKQIKFFNTELWPKDQLRILDL